MADEQDRDGEEDGASPGPDMVLAGAFIGGDDTAFEAFYRRYAGPVHDYVLGIVRDRGLAEDVTQTTFLRAYEQRQSVRDPAAVRAWLYRIAHNTAVNQVSRTVRTDEIPDDAPLAWAGLGPEQSAEQTDSAQLVWDAAASLEPRQFTVLDLALRKGLSSAEIGEVLGLDAAQASLALHRARDALGNAVRYLLVARRRRHCDRLAELVPAGVRALTVEQRASVDRHMRRCPDCQHAALVLTAPDALFGAIPIVALPAVLIDWHPPAGRAPGLTRHGLTRPRLWTMTGAAASVAAVVAAVLVFNGASHHSQPPSVGKPSVSAAGHPLATVATHPFTPIAALAPDTYYGASCPTAATCLAVGKDPSGQPILSTSTDSGATWRTTHPAVQFSLGLITCISPTHCVGAQNTGTSDLFLVSDDAGASWQPAPSPPLSALQSVSCPTANDCLAVGGNLTSGLAEAVASTDGGHSWHPTTAPGPAFSVDCVDASHCWAAGSGAWFTRDLGASWRTISPPPTFDQATGAPPVTNSVIGGRISIYLFGIAFGSATDGIVFGGSVGGGYGRTQNEGALFRSSDGGASWTFWAQSNVDAYGDGDGATCRGSSCLLIADTYNNSVLVSTSDTITWTRRQTFDSHVTGITCTPNGDLCLLLGATGIYLDHTG